MRANWSIIYRTFINAPQRVDNPVIDLIIDRELILMLWGETGEQIYCLRTLRRS